VLIDSYKLSHWMNIRKLTPPQVCAEAGLEDGELADLLSDGRPSVADALAARLSAVLRVDAAQIVPGAARDLTAITMSADEVHASCRPIQRDGIHFYNYYSMAGPPGRVAPVILDILCPAERLPALNNGHLEPAITVNIGPGDIHGRWGDELTDLTWQVLRANRGEDRWIAGDSYVEPAYCPHSYSLASDTPARIISYTAESNLAPLLSELNEWGDDAFARFEADVRGASSGQALARALARRGMEPRDAARLGGVDEVQLEAFAAGDADALSAAELRQLGERLGFDYRVLLPPVRRHDAVGKTCCTVEESRATTRPFRSYRAASTASAPHLPDLVGCFMLVDGTGSADELDLCDAADSHYMVLGGEVSLTWQESGGSRVTDSLGPDGTAWVGPYVAHRWSGEGAVIKLGSGRHAGYWDELELSNTFAPADTLRRGRRDAVGWGYDTNGDTNGGQSR
jgi:hypothetical protein